MTHSLFRSACCVAGISGLAATLSVGPESTPSQWIAQSTPWTNPGTKHHRLLDRVVEEDLAVRAAPAAIRDQATVYVFTDSGYVRARAGNNGFSCLVNRDSFLDGYDALKPTCWDSEGTRTILPMVLRIGKALAHGRTAEQIERDVSASFRDGRLQPPRRAGVAYMLEGDVTDIEPTNGQVLRRSFERHLMLYAPGLTNKAAGIDAGRAMANHTPFVFARSRYHGYIIIPMPDSASQ